MATNVTGGEILHLLYYNCIVKARTVTIQDVPVVWSLKRWWPVQQRKGFLQLPKFISEHRNNVIEFRISTAAKLWFWKLPVRALGTKIWLYGHQFEPKVHLFRFYGWCHHSVVWCAFFHLIRLWYMYWTFPLRTSTEDQWGSFVKNCFLFHRGVFVFSCSKVQILWCFSGWVLQRWKKKKNQPWRLVQRFCSEWSEWMSRYKHSKTFGCHQSQTICRAQSCL